MKYTKKNINNLSMYFFSFIFIVTLFTFSYLYSDKKTELSGDEIVEMVGKLVVLPVDEKPTVATVTSLEPLKESLFFKDAEIGDKVIIYVKSSKAILYRISENKVVEVGPLNIKE